MFGEVPARTHSQPVCWSNKSIQIKWIFFLSASGRTSEMVLGWMGTWAEMKVCKIGWMEDDSKIVVFSD